MIIKGAGRYRLLQHGNGCTIRNITFTGGHAQDGSYVVGGAIYPTGSAIDIYNCAFLFNSSSLHGGAVGGHANNRTGDRCHNCYFYGNSSGGGGYGGAAAGGQFFDCTFVSNTCTYAWGMGGAIYGATLVSGCTVVSNLCLRDGGGIAYSKGVTGSYIAFNATGAGPQPARGGGLYDCGTISNCVVEYNMAKSWGGGLVDTSAFNTTIRANACTRDVKDYSLEKCDVSETSVGSASLVDSCRIHNVSNANFVVDNLLYGPYTVSVTYPFSSVRLVRNSLIDHCGVSASGNPAMFYTDGQVSTRVENCTIADNTINYTLRGFNKAGAVMTLVNCVMARNRSGSVSRDLSGYESPFTCLTNCVLGVKALAQNESMQNSALKTMGESWNPRFAGAGDIPYEPKYSSAVRGAGIVLDWMAGAKDLAGRPRLRDGLADAGCYQCWLDPEATLILIR